MKSFIYGCNVFYPAKWQFQNPCEDKKILDQKEKFVSGYPKSPSSPTPT